MRAGCVLGPEGCILQISPGQEKGSETGGQHEQKSEETGVSVSILDHWIPRLATEWATECVNWLGNTLGASKPVMSSLGEDNIGMNRD